MKLQITCFLLFTTFFLSAQGINLREYPISGELKFVPFRVSANIGISKNLSNENHNLGLEVRYKLYAIGSTRAGRMLGAGIKHHWGGKGKMTLISSAGYVIAAKYTSDDYSLRAKGNPGFYISESIGFTTRRGFFFGLNGSYAIAKYDGLFFDIVNDTTEEVTGKIRRVISGGVVVGFLF